MVKVKICGITNLPDARAAARCGADMLGFNFVPGSPRYITPQRVREIRDQLPPLLFAAGVFADADPAEIEKIADLCRLHYVQLHGNESPDLCGRIRKAEVIKAFRVSKTEDLARMAQYDVSAYLLDARVEGKLGGTGRRIDPSLARRAGRHGPVILAGGLNAGNIKAAIKAAHPFAVDVAGGVEVSPGRKSERLMEVFIRNAKTALIT